MLKQSRRTKRSVWAFDPGPIELDLTMEELMADPGPGWLWWKESAANDGGAAGEYCNGRVA